MMHEVRNIPAAPRRVRLGTVLAHRWPMALLGTFLVGVGGLLSWMLFLAAGAKPSDEHRLNEGPNAEAGGIVTRVQEEPVHVDGKLWQWVFYDFDYGDRQIGGASMAPNGIYAVGMTVTVELLPDEPNRNRIVGTILHVDRIWLAPGSWFALTVVPGALLILGWLAGVFHLRHVLVYGDVSSAQIVTCKPVRWLLPEMVAVTFQFRDHHAVVRSGRHWVRVHSTLGARLIRQIHTGWLEPMPVLHDRRFPQWSRMLLAADFMRGHQSGEGLKNVG